MSDESEQVASGNQGQVRLERLYLKDVSFESPNTPEMFTQAWEPQINLEINNRSQQVGDGHFEVVLTATATASLGEKTAFVVEVQQAAVFAMSGLPEEVVHRAIGTVCPNTLFPYVREAIDSLVVRGGFPALHLAPVNFDAAYADALKQQRDKAH
jgi:preprotein translocase subunit SecB